MTKANDHAGTAREISEGPAWMAPEKLTGFRLFSRVYKVATDEIERELARSGVSLPEFQVLIRLALVENRQMRFHELAGSLIVSQSRVSRLMQSMVEKGYVRRETNERDRRTNFALLTSKGEALLERAYPHFVAAVEEHFLKKVRPEDLDTFVRILGDMASEEAHKPALDSNGTEDRRAPITGPHEIRKEVAVSLTGEIRVVLEGDVSPDAGEGTLVIDVSAGTAYLSRC